MGCIPTALALSRRGINMSSISCQMCFRGVDTADHILLDCPIAFDSLRWIFNWCDVSIQMFLSISDFVNFTASWGTVQKRGKYLLLSAMGFYDVCRKQGTMFGLTKSKWTLQSWRIMWFLWFLVGWNIGVILKIIDRIVGFVPL